MTLFGESAGAVSVGNILSMPRAKGLFQKAILQSGTARSKVTRSDANEMTKSLLEKLHVAESDLSALETIPAQKLLEAIKIFPRTAFGTVGGDGIIAEHPEEVLAEGYAREIPMIIGTTKDESLLFTYFDPVWKQADEAIVKKMFELTYGAHWPGISEHIVGDRKLTKELYEELFSEYVFTIPAVSFNEAQSNHGAQTWMYRFDYESDVLDGQLKAYHALEIPFVWNTVHHPESVKMTGDDDQRYQLADKMHESWIAFAHHGDPNNEEIPYWPPYNLDQRSVFLFGKKYKVSEDPHKNSRETWQKFWKSINGR